MMIVPADFQAYILICIMITKNILTNSYMLSVISVGTI